MLPTEDYRRGYSSLGPTEILDDIVKRVLKFMVCTMPRDEPPCMSFSSQELLPTSGAGYFHNLGLLVISICRNNCHNMADVFFVEISNIGIPLLIFIICHGRDFRLLDLIVAGSHLWVRAIEAHGPPCILCTKPISVTDYDIPAAAPLSQYYGRSLA